MVLSFNSKFNNNSWRLIARENQRLPEGNWNIWLILAGRGFGKTRTAAEATRELILARKCRRVALISSTIVEAEKVMLEGESGLLSISNPMDGVKYMRSQRKVVWRNGATALLFGADEYDKLRGPQFDFAWLDEFAKFKYPNQAFDQLNFSLRLGENPRMIITTTPRPIKILTDIMQRENIHITKGTSFDNIDNLPSTFVEQLSYLKGTALEAQELYGEIISSNADELWQLDNMSSYYKEPNCNLERVIIAVDPAVTSGVNSDETGIIVCGKDEIGNIYVLDDLSTNASSSVWIDMLVRKYREYGAESIVIETNQGGNLIKNDILKIDSSIRVREVFAHNSKKMRAVPIAGLYAQGKVFHVRQFHKLEMQMSTFVSMKKSPDRVDALVWGISTLNKRNVGFNRSCSFIL